MRCEIQYRNGETWLQGHSIRRVFGQYMITQGIKLSVRHFELLQEFLDCRVKPDNDKNHLSFPTSSGIEVTIY